MLGSPAIGRPTDYMLHIGLQSVEPSISRMIKV